jgi:gliding motility-associatede transport system auxiliary component
MTDQTPNEITEQEPFIPPRYLLILSALGFLVAVFVALTQPEFGVVGYGGIAFGLLALFMWVLLSPQEARAVVTGRTARFGGTSLLVTVVLLVALIGVYVVVRNANLRLDLTQTNSFSLSDESRKAIAGLAAEPNAPNVKIIAFYGPSQASSRDQDTLLFDDYVKTSNNKISYEFVDPERQPQTAGLYNVTRAGSIVVVKIGDDGQPVTKNAQTATSSDQGTLTNDILKVSASGVFNAYFLNIKDGTAAQMTVLKKNLTDRYGWNVNDVSLTELGSGPDARYNLDDPNVTGQVIIIPGGSAALADAELKVLEDYINKGGDVIILAGSNLNADKTSLATAQNLNDYLWQNFGVKFNADVVIDKTQAFQSPLIPVSTNLSASSFITSNGIPAGQSALVFEVPNSITIADTAPTNVTVTKLAQSTPSAYAKTDLQAILDNNIDKTDSDAAGPFVLAASAENSQTKARITLLGSTSIGSDTYAPFQGVDNLGVAFNSLIWSTNFNDYFTQITVQQQQRPQDQPIFADQQELRNINFITIVVLPFGILLIGILVWWSNRERSPA